MLSDVITPRSRRRQAARIRAGTRNALAAEGGRITVRGGTSAVQV
jgi:hypothetical protein